MDEEEKPPLLMEYLFASAEHAEQALRKEHAG